MAIIIQGEHCIPGSQKKITDQIFHRKSTNPEDAAIIQQIIEEQQNYENSPLLQRKQIKIGKKNSSSS